MQEFELRENTFSGLKLNQRGKAVKALRTGENKIEIIKYVLQLIENFFFRKGVR